MPDLLSITFKVEQSLRDRIGRAANERDVSQSELIRQGMEFWLELLKVNPSLMDADRKRLLSAARKSAKIILILESD